MQFYTNTPPLKPKQSLKAVPKPNYAYMPIKDAVLEKVHALKSTQIYLIVGIVITFVLYAFHNLMVAGAGIAFFMITLVLTRRELTRLTQKYLK